MSALGRCSRYSKKFCPEIYDVNELNCRYWEKDSPSFGDVLGFGPRPEIEAIIPPCATHYQLARTLLVGLGLARRLTLRPHVWLILPRAKWRTAQVGWMDFVERIQDDTLWNCMRVFAWEDIAGIKIENRPM